MLFSYGTFVKKSKFRNVSSFCLTIQEFITRQSIVANFAKFIGKEIIASNEGLLQNRMRNTMFASSGPGNVYGCYDSFMGIFDSVMSVHKNVMGVLVPTK